MKQSPFTKMPWGKEKHNLVQFHFVRSGYFLNIEAEWQNLYYLNNDIMLRSTFA